MASLARSRASLRVMGDDLHPDDITTMLGAPPSFAHRCGEPIVGRATTRIARFGMWLIDADETDPADPDGQVAQLLRRVTSDLSVWRELGERYEVDLFCGWFMECGNEGVSLSAATMRALGERGIPIDIDLYRGGDDEDSDGA